MNTRPPINALVTVLNITRRSFAVDFDVQNCSISIVLQFAAEIASCTNVYNLSGAQLLPKKSAAD